jgi:hypothetical protein
MSTEFKKLRNGWFKSADAMSGIVEMIRSATERVDFQLAEI